MVLLAVLAACSTGSAEDDTDSADVQSAGTCATKPLVAPSGPSFIDISASSGIQVGNFVAGAGASIPINDHSRLAFVDLDGDGKDDIVAHNLYPNAQKGVPFEHLVYRNRGDKTFEDFSDASGLRGVQAAFFAFADVDNDGDQDCFAGLDIELDGQTSALYLNDGHGHFTKKARSGLEGIALVSNAVFGDFNGDAKIDMYAGIGSSSYAKKDQLFFGNGDGTFKEVSQNLAAAPEQPTNGVVACDYDDDGDLDILVSHYGVSVKQGWRALWQNDGKGKFTNVAKDRGFHALGTGNRWLASTGNGEDVQPGDPSAWIGANGFGIDCQDVDGDGHNDVWVATIAHPVDEDFSRKWSDSSQLLINKGPAGGFGFEPVTAARKIPFNEGDIDAAAVDFDNDGLVDLSVTHDRKYESGYTTEDQKSWTSLYRQTPGGDFASIGLASGINDTSGKTDRGKAGQNLAWSDIDGDGDLDLVVGGRDNGNGGRANWLFENTLGNKNGFVGVRLRGDGTHINRDALGARVTVRIGTKQYMRELKSSRGTYSAADSRAMLFGIGADGCSGRTSTASIEVRWPDGKKDIFKSVALNRYLTIDYATHSLK